MAMVISTAVATATIKMPTPTKTPSEKPTPMKTPTPTSETAEQRYARPESSDVASDDPRAVTLPIQRSSPTSSLRQNQSALARASRQSREMMSGDEEGGGCCGWDCEEPTPGVGQLIDDTAGGMNDVQGDSAGARGREGRC